MRNNSIETIVQAQPFHCCFRSTLHHTRNIVRGVAYQCQIVDNPVRWHAEFFDHTCYIQCGVTHRVYQGDMLIDQLSQVFVTGRYNDFPTLFGRLIRQRADHIICFHTRNAQQRQSHGADNFVKWLNLCSQIVRHRWSCGLVLGIHIVAKGFSFCVKNHRHVRWMIIFQQASKHVDNAKHGAGRLPFPVGQGWQCVKRTEQIGRSIYQDKWCSI